MTTAPIHCPINFRWKKYLETKTSSLIQQHQQKKDNHSASENDQQFTLNQPQKNQTRSRGTTRFRNPNKSRQQKIKRRVQNFKKFGKTLQLQHHPIYIGDYPVLPSTLLSSILFATSSDRVIAMMDFKREERKKCKNKGQDKEMNKI